MAGAGESGSLGENDVIATIRCPNCRSELLLLPPSNPLFDVQCNRCIFRAQVKTARCKPKSEIFGAGWDILDKTLKAGQMVPPLIVNFRWEDKTTGEDCQAIYFFPFLTRANLKARTRSDDGLRPGYKEFNYVGLDGPEVPRQVLHKSGPVGEALFSARTRA